MTSTEKCHQSGLKTVSLTFNNTSVKISSFSCSMYSNVKAQRARLEPTKNWGSSSPSSCCYTVTDLWPASVHIMYDV